MKNIYETLKPSYDSLAERLTVAKHVGEVVLPFYASMPDLELCDPVEDGWIYNPDTAEDGRW